ncbi:MAG: molybdopterin-dependent oxidoreductase [Acidobacteria bacterium]|nr:molybdopterin-dependent oxidoreductase [Acidobacteriota bacterium]
MERRTFIIGGVAGSLGLLQYVIASRYMHSLRAPPALSVRTYTKFGPQAAVVAVTPNDDFYITSKGMSARVNLDQWRLKIDGLVRRPLTFTYAELLALPIVEPVTTLECISNPIGGTYIGNARWTGTALRPLLQQAGPKAKARHAVLHAADGYTTGIPLDRILHEENFLVYRMNGAPLPVSHGYPLRILLPGKFGMKQPKWLTRIEFVSEKHLGFWEEKNWSDEAERSAHARFTDLKNGTTLTGQNLELVGYAVGPLEGIQAVEISFDQGNTWKATDLFSNPSPLIWTFWRYLWADPAPGEYEIRVRAVDGVGRVQTYGPRGIFPDGATGQQKLTVKVVGEAATT